jgi:galactokinase
MQVMEKLFKRIEDPALYSMLFGNNAGIIKAKKEMLLSVCELFRDRFSESVRAKEACLISVPNRVELLGKHTDYQGGETLLLTGPKNFFALSSPASDGCSELVNVNPEYGSTCLKLSRGEPELLAEGEGSNYTYTVAKRLMRNMDEAGLSALCPADVKSVFLGDIPFGGGTSGSSAKLISDFFILASANNILSDDDFLSLVTENGKKAGLKLGSVEVSDFSLALSMYLAHHENGFDFGELKGDRGVGTFGGSEDHTAIVLGERDTLLYCRYCPTEIIEKIKMPPDHFVVVAYSGKKAEKTKEAMLKYNRLSEEAASAVEKLNDINKTDFKLMRDFFQGHPPEEKAGIAYEQLCGVKDGLRLAERAYQFFRETEITGRAVKALEEGSMSSFGNLINESHELSLQYLRNIVPEVDWLQRSANELGALGATGFGAGFGGSCYAVVPVRRLESFIVKWRERYIKKFSQYREVAAFDVYSACRGVYWERLRLK